MPVSQKEHVIGSIWRRGCNSGGVLMNLEKGVLAGCYHEVCGYLRASQRHVSGLSLFRVHIPVRNIL
jgi:hypothetical protein